MEDEWRRRLNGGGHRFTDSLGFGHIDAHAAVRLAETWTKQSTFANLEDVRNSFHGAAPADDQGYGIVAAEEKAELTTSIAAPVRVQHVAVKLDMLMTDGAASLRDVSVTLKSPSGQETALMNPSRYTPIDPQRPAGQHDPDVPSKTELLDRRHSVLGRNQSGRRLEDHRQ